MPSANASLTMTISVIDQASPALRQIANSLQQIRQPTQRLQNPARQTNSLLNTLMRTVGSFRTASSAMGGGALDSAYALGKMATAVEGVSVAAAASMAVVAGLGYAYYRIGSAALDAAAASEKYHNQIRVILKDTKLADATFAQLKGFALKSPFDTETVMTQARLLLGMGIKAENLVDIMTALGNAAMGDTERFKGLAIAYGQMSAKGKIQGEELMQMAERGIPVYQILQEKLGVNRKRLDEMLRSGKMLSEKVLPLIIQGLKERFPNAMAQAANEAGSLEKKIGDLRTIMLETIGATMLPEYEKFLRGVVQGMNRLQKKVEEFAKSPEFVAFSKAFFEFLSAIGEVIEPIIEEFIDFSRTLMGFLAPALELAAWFLRLVASVLRTIVSVLKLAHDNFRQFAAVIRAVVNFTKPFRTAIEGVVTGIEALITKFVDAIRQNGLLTASWNLVSDAAKAVATFIGSIVTALADWMKNETKYGDFFKGMTTLVNDFKLIVIGAWEALLNVLGINVPEVKPVITPTKSPDYQTTMDPILADFNKLVDKTITVTVKKASDYATVVAAIAVDVATWTDKIITVTVKKATDYATVVAAIATDVATWTNKTIQVTVAKASSWTSDTQAITDALTNAGLVAKSITLTVTNSVTTGITSVLNEFKAAFGDAAVSANKLVDFTRTITYAIIESLTSTAWSVAKQITDQFGTQAQTTSGLVNFTKTITYAIVSDLTSTALKVRTAITDALGAVAYFGGLVDFTRTITYAIVKASDFTTNLNSIPTAITSALGALSHNTTQGLVDFTRTITYTVAKSSSFDTTISDAKTALAGITAPSAPTITVVDNASSTLSGIISKLAQIQSGGKTVTVSAISRSGAVGGGTGGTGQAPGSTPISSGPYIVSILPCTRYGQEGTCTNWSDGVVHFAPNPVHAPPAGTAPLPSLVLPSSPATIVSTIPGICGYTAYWSDGNTSWVYDSSYCPPPPAPVVVPPPPKFVTSTSPGNCGYTVYYSDGTNEWVNDLSYCPPPPAAVVIPPPAPFVLYTFAGICGYTRGWSDGRVEWVDDLSYCPAPPAPINLLPDPTPYTPTPIDYGGGTTFSDFWGSIGGYNFFANGGIVTQATAGIVGEAGAEAIIPLDQLDSYLPAPPTYNSGSVSISNLHINVSGHDDPAAAGRAAARSFKRYIGMQRRFTS